MVFAMRNEKLIRKYDLYGTKYLGKIHSADFGFEMQRSGEILAKNSKQLIRSNEGVVAWSAYRQVVYPANVDCEMSWASKKVKSQNIDLWTDKTYFEILKDGVYGVFCQNATELPIVNRITYCALKLKVNQYDVYLLDAESTSVIILPSGNGYHHSVFLNGGVVLGLNKGDRLCFYFYFESDLPNTTMTTYHTRYCWFEYLGAKWGE